MSLFWRKLADFHDAITSASFAGAAAVLGIIAFSFCYEVTARYFFAVAGFLLGASSAFRSPSVY